jgi:hypothetical protein
MTTTTGSLASNAASTMPGGGKLLNITPDIWQAPTTDVAALDVDNCGANFIKRTIRSAARRGRKTRDEH